MRRDQRERDLPTKQEASTIIDHKASTAGSRLWSGLKNPRIVRVSRAFGGKDRHSKVSTIRGLRDRRVRLSVPTAIQLYDLQDRLGLNQPSKVVDWLLNAAQHEIDKLPPLQFPPESFPHFSQSNEAPSFGFLKENGSHKANASENWSSEAIQKIKQREDQPRKPEEVKSTNDELLQRSSVPSFLSNTTAFSPYYQLEASNACFSQFGGRNSFPHYDAPLLCPQGMMPPMFSSYVANPNEFDVRLQMASSVSQNQRDSLGGPSARPFQ